jgi:hypothetical protein
MAETSMNTLLVHRACFKFHVFLTVSLMATSLNTQLGHAQILGNPALTAKGTTIEGAIALTETEYDFGDVTRDIERSILGVTVMTEVAPAMDLFGQLGVVFDAEIESPSVENDGSGFMMGAGLRTVVHQTAQGRLHAWGLFNWTKESYEAFGDLEYDLDIFDLNLGAVWLHKLTPMFQPWLGLDLGLYSNGEIEAKAGSATVTEDAERDDRINLRFGGNLNLDKGTLRAEVILVGETSFAFGFGTNL